MKQIVNLPTEASAILWYT